MKTVELSKGYVTLVDDADFEAVSEHSWVAWTNPRGTTYAVRYEGRRTIWMHREIFSAPLVDHEDGDGLNNQRSNLRAATKSQNNHNSKRPRSNTSGFKGVVRARGKWRAQVKLLGKTYYFGSFTTPEQADAAARAGRTQLHGEFARHS